MLRARMIWRNVIEAFRNFHYLLAIPHRSNHYQDPKPLSVKHKTKVATFHVLSTIVGSAITYLD